MDEEEGVICHYSALSADKEAMAAKTLLCCCCVCVSVAFWLKRYEDVLFLVVPACSPRASRAQPG